jgi:hypothetical protein
MHRDGSIAGGARAGHQQTEPHRRRGRHHGAGRLGRSPAARTGGGRRSRRARPDRRQPGRPGLAGRAPHRRRPGRGAVGAARLRWAGPPADQRSVRHRPARLVPGRRGDRLPVLPDRPLRPVVDPAGRLRAAAADRRPVRPPGAAVRAGRRPDRLFHRPVRQLRHRDPGPAQRRGHAGGGHRRGGVRTRVVAGRPPARVRGGQHPRRRGRPGHRRPAHRGAGAGGADRALPRVDPGRPGTALHGEPGRPQRAVAQRRDRRRRHHRRGRRRGGVPVPGVLARRPAVRLHRRRPHPAPRTGR